jgi:uncharacterized MAPEG superfamily protein
MTPELKWMAATGLFTAILWMPYIVSLLGQMGIMGGLMDGEHATGVEAKWAQRAKRAHANAVENLVVFGALAIPLSIAGMGTELTATAAFVFFISRIGHWLVYLIGLPLIRTLFFAAGFVCQLILGLTLFGVL